MSAFTLLELLVVIAVIGVLAALVVPAFNSIGNSHTVTRDGQLLNDQINHARQLAITRNRETELRIVSYTAGAGESWAIQIWDVGKDQAINAVTKLGDNVVINETLSPMLDNLETGNAVFPPLGSGTTQYHALKFRPDGRVKGSFPARQDYVTLHHRTDSAAAPVNYFVLQIQSLTGRISIYRP